MFRTKIINKKNKFGFWKYFIYLLLILQKRNKWTINSRKKWIIFEIIVFWKKGKYLIFNNLKKLNEQILLNHNLNEEKK